ncbi:alanine/ornithine racemase family PLP-dependent enzyme [Candidatus Izimaplasma bacterium]|nr:alanine/ornithine racemase family PLP-dependent enzyme [Candidatus Izimaplasma bacterium]
MYPRIIINKDKFRHNLRTMLDISHANNLTVMAVSKVFCADQELLSIMIEEEVDFIADSRIQNLTGIHSVIPKVLLRLPMHGEVIEVVKHSDISLNSELSTIKLLNSAAKDLNKIHGIIVMIDLGDLREGIIEEIELFSVVEEVLKMEHIALRGIGTNLTCYGGIIPTEENLSRLVEFKDKIEQKYDISLEIISGGNSSSIELMNNGLIPVGINNIRLGESVVLGRETAFGNFIDNTYNDVFTFEADIIEVKEKPTVPIGLRGMNAFGKVPIFKDKGITLRAILAVGKQDVDHTELIPFDTVNAIGSSSDHIIVDVSNSYNVYEVGDQMLFRLTYGSILSLMTSKYVTKYYE